MAEEEAIRRGCRAATLVTVNFQAPEFYARHGWEEFGRIPQRTGRGTHLHAQETDVMTEAIMHSIKLDTEAMDWTPGSPLYGPGAICKAANWCRSRSSATAAPRAKASPSSSASLPPEGKVIRIIAVAQSDEHIFNLEGGRGTKSGERLRFSGNYGLNPRGKPHSAFIGTETMALLVYTGEPDEIRSIDVIDKG